MLKEALLSWSLVALSSFVALMNFRISELKIFAFL
jgi:hypothetical protein